MPESKVWERFRLVQRRKDNMKKFFIYALVGGVIVSIIYVGSYRLGYRVGRESQSKMDQSPQSYFNAGASCAALAMLKHRLSLDPFTNLNQVNSAAWEIFSGDSWLTNKTIAEWQAANGPRPATTDELTAFAETQPYPIRATLLVVAGAHIRDLDEDLADYLELYAKRKVLAMTNQAAQR